MVTSSSGVATVLLSVPIAPRIDLHATDASWWSATPGSE
jgi:hypothetical protein